MVMHFRHRHAPTGSLKFNDGLDSPSTRSGLYKGLVPEQLRALEISHVDRAVPTLTLTIHY